jgi:uncharacterized protein (TIGR01777 family)
MQVLVTGGTGVVGRPLVEQLARNRHNVTVLSRCVTPSRVADGVRLARWDPESGAGLAAALRGADAVVHLARSPLPSRWTRQARDAIFASRVGMVRRIVDAIASSDAPPTVFLCGSSHDFYGERASDTPLSEEQPAGGDVLARLYADVEREAERARSPRVRVILARVGVVLGPGALDPRWIPHVVADSHGALSWVYVEDCARMLGMAIEHAVAGALNVTARKPTTAIAVVEELRRLEGRAPSEVAVANLRRLLRARAGAVAQVAVPVERGEDHVLYQPHWAYPAIMERLQYRWQVAEVEQALRPCRATTCSG